MKKLLFLLALFCPAAFAQSTFWAPSVSYVSSAPSGACSAAPPIQIVISTGVVYTCDNGTWAAVSGGGGGGVTSFTGDGTIFNNSASTGAVTATLANTPTGTGSVVLATSPTLVTPALGTPASGVITNLTGTCTACTANATTTIPGAINPQTSTYQVLASDFSGYKTITVASGTFTITLVASGSQPAAGQYISIINYGSGVVTVARSGQNINGATTSYVIGAGTSVSPNWVKIWSDGTNYFADGLGQPVVVGNVRLGNTTSTIDTSSGASLQIARSTIPASAGVYDLGQSNQAWNRVYDSGNISVGTKFTATGCTSITSTVGGATAGQFVIGANTCTVVITMNGATGETAPNGWACGASDETTAAGNTGLYFSAHNATTATLTVPATAVASDVIVFRCTGY